MRKVEVVLNDGRKNVAEVDENLSQAQVLEQMKSMIPQGTRIIEIKSVSATEGDKARKDALKQYYKGDIDKLVEKWDAGKVSKEKLGYDEFQKVKGLVNAYKGVEDLTNPDYVQFMDLAKKEVDYRKSLGDTKGPEIKEILFPELSRRKGIGSSALGLLKDATTLPSRAIRSGVEELGPLSQQYTLAERMAMPEKYKSGIQQFGDEALAMSNLPNMMVKQAGRIPIVGEKISGATSKAISKIAGDTPQSVVLGDLVDAVKPGRLGNIAGVGRRTAASAIKDSPTLLAEMGYELSKPKDEEGFALPVIAGFGLGHLAQGALGEGVQQLAKKTGTDTPMSLKEWLAPNAALRDELDKFKTGDWRVGEGMTSDIIEGPIAKSQEVVGKRLSDLGTQREGIVSGLGDQKFDLNKLAETMSDPNISPEKYGAYLDVIKKMPDSPAKRSLLDFDMELRKRKAASALQNPDVMREYKQYKRVYPELTPLDYVEKKQTSSLLSVPGTFKFETPGEIAEEGLRKQAGQVNLTLKDLMSPERYLDARRNNLDLNLQMNPEEYISTRTRMREQGNALRELDPLDPTSNVYASMEGVLASEALPEELSKNYRNFAEAYELKDLITPKSDYGMKAAKSEDELVRNIARARIQKGKRGQEYKQYENSLKKIKDWAGKGANIDDIDFITPSVLNQMSTVGFYKTLGDHVSDDLANKLARGVKDILVAGYADNVTKRMVASYIKNLSLMGKDESINPQLSEIGVQ